MAAWIFLALAFASLAPEPAPTLTLVWHDSAHVFPWVGLRRLGDEMEALFRENGLSVTFHAASEHEDLMKIPEPRINAIVLPGEDSRFGLRPNTMAAAHGGIGQKYGIFVFYPGVRRTLGHRDGETSPRHVAELSRALARIVAHEVVHVLAPERGHADSGLMSGKLTREELLADGIDLDGPSLERATVAMKEWGCLAPPPGSSKFPIPTPPLRSIVRGGGTTDMSVRKMTPVLIVERIEPSIELWVDRLGFEKTIEVPEGDHIGFVAFAREEIEIMYQTRESVETEVRTADLPKALLPGAGNRATLFCEVSDLKSIREKLQGLDILLPYRKTAYGAEELWMREPGGHIVGFAEFPKE